MEQNSNFRNTYAFIDLKALAHNCRQLMSMQNNTNFFCPMIKSNAYGHGDVEVAKTLIDEGVKNLGVALVEEGIRLRKSGIGDCQILVFGPYFDDPTILQTHNLVPVVSSAVQLKDLIKKLKGDLSVHIKLNTGMNRLGVDPKEFYEVDELLRGNKNIKLVGLCSHLASGEDYLEKSHSAEQLENFKSGLKVFDKHLKGEKHIFNSSGMIARYLNSENQNPDEKGFGSRPGISLYGVKPKICNLSSEQQKKWDEIHFHPVMSLHSEIVAFHELDEGEKVSYNGTWAAPRKSVVGVIPIGYADGFQRLFTNKGLLLFRGMEVPVVGRVCMDYTMVDLTSALKDGMVNIGEKVILFGEHDGVHLPVEKIAKIADTISYELLTGIGRRVPRKYS